MKVGMDLQEVSEPLRNTAGHAPLRRPGSLRRTSTIDASFPNGRSGEVRLLGRARDVVTPLSGRGLTVLAEDGFDACLRPDRTIVSLRTEPARPALSALVGERGGGRLREAIDRIAPEERRDATPLHLLLDDISGASLVSSWAWSQWDPDWLSGMRDRLSDPKLAAQMAQRRTVCIGLANLPVMDQAGAEAVRRWPLGGDVPDLRHPADPQGWHALAEQKDAGMRRARRMDISRDELIVIDAAFQDSASTPDGGRRAVHEYQVTVKADPRTLEVVAVVADPRVLPHTDCPGAAANVGRLVGTPLAEMRQKVLAELKGTVGCTHLNDALRALADAPVLLKRLDAALAAD